MKFKISFKSLLNTYDLKIPRSIWVHLLGFSPFLSLMVLCVKFLIPILLNKMELLNGRIAIYLMYPDVCFYICNFLNLCGILQFLQLIIWLTVFSHLSSEDAIQTTTSYICTGLNNIRQDKIYTWWTTYIIVIMPTPVEASTGRWVCHLDSKDTT